MRRPEVVEEVEEEEETVGAGIMRVSLGSLGKKMG